jgi:hypothetical protein
MRKIRVYVAGPLTAGGADNISLNIRTAMEITDKLLNKGFIPFCPHLLFFQHCAFWRSYQAWLDYDMEWLQQCDAVLRIKGESAGSDKEVELAKSLGIPVFYSFNDLEKQYETPENQI